MTPELQKRLESSLPPFSRLCIHNIEELSLAQLREILSSAFASLEPLFPSVSLFFDWHGHKCFIKTSRDISCVSLTAAVENERALYESRDDDVAVRTAIDSPIFDWLLRYNIDSNDESDYSTNSCDFDLSASPKIGSIDILNESLNRFPGMLVGCKSRSWFTSRYGG